MASQVPQPGAFKFPGLCVAAYSVRSMQRQVNQVDFTHLPCKAAITGHVQRGSRERGEREAPVWMSVRKQFACKGFHIDESS